MSLFEWKSVVKKMEDCTNRRNRELKVYDSTDDLATDLADYIAHLSETSVMERGYFSVALSGGPLIGFLRKLCGVPYTRTVDWTKWYIFWADERVVSRNHVDSNYKLAKDEFLTKVPVLPGRVHSINDSLSAEDAAADYQFVLRQMVKMRAVSVSESDDCPMFDLILLSMGHDGHIASLFPGHPALEQNGEWVTHLTDSPRAPLERITFTLPVINSASNVAVLAVGEANAEAARIATSPAFKGVDDASALPVQLVQPTNGKLVWFLDKAAASKLDASVWNSLE